MFKRAILHLDLDAFFVSVECQKNDALKGRPLIIGGSSRRGVVASCSYEARAFGVRSAMPMAVALRMCPDALVLKGDMDSYSKYSNLVSEIIADEAPLFEKSSIDEFYLDISGLDQYFGCYKWAVHLRKKIMDNSGLPISFGLSANKLVSKVGAGESKPNGMMQVLNGNEKSFLAPLSILKLPSVGQATYKKLRLMGVHKVQTLSAIPVKLLEREFGKPGMSLWKKANGIDNTPVVPYTEKKSISTERTFHEDTIDVRKMKDLLTGMIEKLAFELRDSQKLTSCVVVKIRYSDFNTYTKQKRISYTANDNTLLQIVMELFDSVYTRRQLIRLVGVKFSGLVHGNYQINIFDNTVKEIRLLQEMDQIRKRFGKSAIMKATSLIA